MLARFAVGLVLLSTSPARADFQAGCADFDRGDFAAARERWAPLAEQGDAKAQFRLGCLYAFGQGVPEDYGFALRLYRLAAGAPLAIRGTKQAVNASIKAVLGPSFDLATALEIATFASADHAEALAALAEKRVPRFEGR